MKLSILSRFNAPILFEHEAEENSLKITLQVAVKTDADLYGADLRGAKLRDADLRDANLRGADLRDANLRGADFRGANLYGADLDGADLYGADLRDANLRDANLRGASLRGANLCGANLRGANLRDANLRGADLCGADLDGADLDGEKLVKTPLQLNNLKWFVLISDKYLRIGCQRFTIEEWRNFDDAAIVKMDFAALKFWRKWKAPIIALCDAHNTAENATEGGEE